MKEQKTIAIIGGGCVALHIANMYAEKGIKAEIVAPERAEQRPPKPTILEYKIEQLAPPAPIFLHRNPRPWERKKKNK